MGDLPGKRLWHQLSMRRVFHVALIYLLIAWVLIYPGEVFLHWMDMPSWSQSVLTVFVLLGFPLVLYLAWNYEITRRGIRTNSGGHIESVTGLDDHGDENPSIAVLPFDDRSRKGNQLSFCEGFAEEVLNDLYRFTGFRVVPRVAAFHFDAGQTDLAEVGRKLGVQTVLKGGVDKSGDELRVDAQLVGVDDGTPLWSYRFEGGMDEIFDIHEELVSSITKVLGGSLQQENGLGKQRVDPRAYDLFLRGLSYFARHTIQDNVYSRQVLRQAVDIEPDYGRAWAGIAYTHGYEYMYFNASDVNLAEARLTSDRALKLSPHLPQSHVASGIAYCMRQDYKHAESEFEKAIRLDPKNYQAWYFFGRAKVHQGDLRRALKLFERAAKVRPEDFQSVLLQAQLYTNLDQKGKAFAVTREGIKRVRARLALNPNNDRALNMGAFALLHLGEMEEAVKWMQRSLYNAPMDSIIQYNGACFFSLSGKVERALDCLENCVIKVGNINREWLSHDSDMDNIRDHPRYQEIIKTFPE